MSMRKGDRLCGHTDKTLVCDRCDAELNVGHVSTIEAVRMAEREGWRSVKNGLEPWNLCPGCADVQAPPSL